jgi:hypothetical protein
MAEAIPDRNQAEAKTASTGKTHTRDRIKIVYLGRQGSGTQDGNGEFGTVKSTSELMPGPARTTWAAVRAVGGWGR